MFNFFKKEKNPFKEKIKESDKESFMKYLDRLDTNVLALSNRFKVECEPSWYDLTKNINVYYILDFMSNVHIEQFVVKTNDTTNQDDVLLQVTNIIKDYLMVAKKLYETNQFVYEDTTYNNIILQKDAVNTIVRRMIEQSKVDNLFK